MNLKRKLLIAISYAVVMISCNESISDPATEKEPEIKTDYSIELAKLLPWEMGEIYNFTVDTLNVFTNTFDNVGVRAATVEGKVTEGSSTNINCSEAYSFNGNPILSQSVLRVTENTIDIFPNVSGLSELIPDSLDIEIDLILDEVFTMIEYPYNDKHEWSVFKAGANFGTFKFSVISITGQYEGSETLQLEGLETSYETEKFKYTIEMNIPNINNPFISNLQQYEAIAWFAPDVGLVQLEGCSMLIKPISGQQFNDADSNSVTRHILNAMN